MKRILTDNNISVFLLGGMLCHLFNFNIDIFTLQGNTIYSILFWISTVLGYLFLIWEMELLDDKSYRTLKSNKLKIFKAFILVFSFGLSALFCGGLLNTIALGTNILVQDSELIIEEFQVNKIHKVKPKMKKRTTKRVPELDISNDVLDDNIRLDEINYNTFNKNIENVSIKYKKGLWGWGIIKEITF